MHGFRDNKVSLQAGYDVIVISPLGALPANFHVAFWKSDHDFLIVFHTNFSSRMHGFRHNEVLLQARYDITVISPSGGALPANFHDGFWKSDHCFLIVFHSNFLYVMHGFRDNEVLLQAGYDVIVISPLGGASGDFSWRILKDRPWLPDSVLYQLLSRMHGSRDNEVLLPTGNDVIVISPLGGVSHRFCWRNLKERPQFHNYG